jgi:hypothetical protein
MYYDNVEQFDTTMFVSENIECKDFVAVYSLDYVKIIDTAFGINKMTVFHISKGNLIQMMSKSAPITRSTCSLSYNSYKQVKNAHISKTSLYNIIHENNKLYFIPKTPVIAYTNTRLFDGICLDILRIPDIPRDVMFEIMRALMWLFIDDRTKYACVIGAD